MRISLAELKNQLIKNDSVFIGALYREVENLENRLSTLDFSNVEVPKRECVKAGATYLRFRTSGEDGVSTLYFTHAKGHKARCFKYTFENATFLIYRVEKHDGTLYTMCIYAIPNV